MDQAKSWMYLATVGMTKDSALQKARSGSSLIAGMDKISIAMYESFGNHFR
jgi:hypothetical protein